MSSVSFDTIFVGNDDATASTRVQKYLQTSGIDHDTHNAKSGIHEPVGENALT